MVSFGPTDPTRVVIANVPKEYTLDIHGAAESDKAKMVLGADCEEGEWQSVVNGKVVFTLPLAATPYRLCYKFADEAPVLYEQFNVTVFYLSEIQIDDGARNDALLFLEDNALRFHGVTFPGDKIAVLANPLNLPQEEFSNDDCLGDRLTLEDYIDKEADGAYHVSVRTGGSVLICYLFDGETRPFLTNFNLLVLGVSVPAVVSNGVELGTSTNLWAVRDVPGAAARVLARRGAGGALQVGGGERDGLRGT